MTTLKNIFAALFLITFATTASFAQYDASATANTSATIITPIDISKNVDLSFGNIIASASDGSVTVDLSNSRTQDGGATFPSIGGTVTSAEFTVTGMAGVAFTLTLPADGASVLTGTTTDMELVDFKSNAPSTIDDGSITFQVGATLKVNADQPAGNYTGSFDAIVNYN